MRTYLGSLTAPSLIVVVLSSASKAALPAIAEHARESDGLLGRQRVGTSGRPRAIVNVFAKRFHLNQQHIARLTKISNGVLDAYLQDPGTVSPETKIDLGSRVSYLSNAVANARPSPPLPEALAP